MSKKGKEHNSKKNSHPSGMTGDEVQKAEQKAGVRPENKAASRPESKAGRKPVNSAGNRPDAKAGNRPESKAGNRPESKAGNRPESKTGNRPESKAGSTSESKAGSTPESKAGNTPDAKTGSRTDSRIRNDMENGAEKTEGNRKKHWLVWKIIFGIVLPVLLISDLVIVYSDIPFIAKWRTIYIETAMTTNSHQWLATLFFPDSVIDEVMARRKQSYKEQAKVESKWEPEEEEEPEDTAERDAFFASYPELDSLSVRTYLEKHPELVEDGYDKLKLKNMENDLGLFSPQGETVLAIDIPNHLLILGVRGDTYQGKLAIVKDPSQIELGKSKALGSFGQEIDSFCRDYDAVLGINASGFVDVDGVGTGGEVNGCLVVDGVNYGRHYTDWDWKFFGFKNNNRMYISNYTYGMESEYRWGMEFFPALIVDGANLVDGTYGMGIQPRSAFGQRKNGDVLMLVVDGRQVGYSLGCTVNEMSDILLRYQAYQAMNLDGGSSSVMYYDGEFITRSSSVTGRGRYMPDAFLVKRVDGNNDQ